MSWLSNLFSAPKPPPVTPAGDVIKAQTAANTQALQESQAATQINQQNQYGSQNYQQSGVDQYGNPTYTLKTQLSTPQQALLDTLQGTQQTAGTQGRNLLSGADYGSQNPADVIGNATQGNTAQLIAQQMQQLAPVQESQRQNLDNQLRNQGLFPGNPAYDRQMRDFTNNISNANAANAATFENQAYEQAFRNFMTPAALGQQLSQFGGPIDLKSTFANTPQFGAAPANATAAYADVNKANMEAYKQQQANYSSMLNGIFGIGGSILGGPIGGALGSSLGGLFKN